MRQKVFEENILFDMKPPNIVELDFNDLSVDGDDCNGPSSFETPNSKSDILALS